MGSKALLGVFVGVLLILSLTSCSDLTGKTVLRCEGGVCYLENNTGTANATNTNIQDLFNNITGSEPVTPIEEPPSELLTITVNETEAVRIRPKAIDPDNDKLKYTFSAPLDSNGEWQTKIGDAGKYVVTVTVTDGQLSSSQKILIIVNAKNQAPIISGVSDISVIEGNAIALRPHVTDPDSDDVTVSYSGWLTGPDYQTAYMDAGTHTVTITASDGKLTSSKTITITVMDMNRVPVIQQLDSIVATEKDMVRLNVQVSDPDGDKVTISYPRPFNSNGEWQTAVGEAGIYKVTVSATDGKSTVSSDGTIEIKPYNRAPEITISDVTVDEGATVILTPSVTDPDGDAVSMSYSGWMTENTRKTSYGDAGIYKVTITASDGKTTVSKDFKVMVRHVNRAPVIVGIESSTS